MPLTPPPCPSTGLDALKALPAARQQAIVQRPDKELEAEREALAAEGIQVSAAELKEFIAWWRWREWFADLARHARLFEEELAQLPPTLAPGEVARWATLKFELEASRKGKGEEFARIETLRQRAEAETGRHALRRELLDLQRERFEWDAARACLAYLPALQAIASEASLDDWAKIDRIRELLFGAPALPPPPVAGRTGPERPDPLSPSTPTAVQTKLFPD